MKERCFNISDLHPSDVPRAESWVTAQEKVRNGTFRFPLDISAIGTTVLELDTVLTVPERNHLLAALLMMIGDAKLTGTPLHPAHYHPDLWAYQIQRVEAEGIRTFSDYISAATIAVRESQR